MQNDIVAALKALQQGKVILYPTDTVWGLGCDATNYDAIERIFEIKKRPESKSMLVLVSNFVMLQQYVKSVPFKAVELMDEATYPLTVIYPEAKNLAPNLIASDGSIGIRIPNDEFCKTLISEFGKPIVSTSANISGHKPGAFFSEIEDEIKSQTDYIVNYRRDDNHKSDPSSIVKVNYDGSITKIR
ncbi:MAG: threonylcarbamoyl-AMP synthase [Bacteroidales bacterium]|nr:threonylcarbamoyl-AMP synthase [Bacteroidales bacterium]